MGKIIFPGPAPLIGPNGPPPNSNMMLVHKKTLSVVMARDRWLAAQCKELAAKNAELQAALDEAFLDNRQLGRLCSQLAGTWTVEEEHALDELEAGFEAKYSGRLKARAEQPKQTLTVQEADNTVAFPKPETAE